jgi:hypothetical protein
MKYNKTIPKVKNIGLQNNYHYLNKLGLDKAYESNNKLHIQEDTLFVAGTSNLQDIWDDLKIPLGLTRYSQRYKDAEKLLVENPQIKSVIGHSLGSAVSDELSKRNTDKKLKTTLYGSPFVDFTGTQSENRFRHKFDPISIFDRKAQTVDLGLVSPFKSHGYEQY